MFVCKSVFSRTGFPAAASEDTCCDVALDRVDGSVCHSKRCSPEPPQHHIGGGGVTHDQHSHLSSTNQVEILVSNLDTSCNYDSFP